MKAPEYTLSSAVVLSAASRELPILDSSKTVPTTMLTLEKRFLAKPCAEMAAVRSTGLMNDCRASNGVWKTWPTPTPSTI